MRTNRRRPALISDNIFAHCDQSGGPDSCWPFMRARSTQAGYGYLSVDGRLEAAHRFAYTQAVGPIPSDDMGKPLWILHHCDNKPCCNPAHLYVGSRLDNVRDKEERNPGTQPKGEANAKAKLRTRDILFIRRCADLYSGAQMARMLGVHTNTVNQILRGEHWRSVPFERPSRDRALLLDDRHSQI